MQAGHRLQCVPLKRGERRLGLGNEAVQADAHLGGVALALRVGFSLQGPAHHSARTRLQVSVRWLYMRPQRRRRKNAKTPQRPHPTRTQAKPRHVPPNPSERALKQKASGGREADKLVLRWEVQCGEGCTHCSKPTSWAMRRLRAQDRTATGALLAMPAEQTRNKRNAAAHCHTLPLHKKRACYTPHGTQVQGGHARSPSCTAAATASGPLGSASSTRPSALASVPDTKSPENSRRAACCGPTSLGRKWVEPMPGCRPRPTNVNPILASAAATRMSQAREMQAPAPMAAPFRAAMVGTGNSRRQRKRA